MLINTCERPKPKDILDWFSFLQDPPHSFEKTKKFPNGISFSLSTQCSLFRFLPTIGQCFPKVKISDPVDQFDFQFVSDPIGFVETKLDANVKESVNN